MLFTFFICHQYFNILQLSVEFNKKYTYLTFQTQSNDKLEVEVESESEIATSSVSAFCDLTVPSEPAFANEPGPSRSLLPKTERKTAARRKRKTPAIESASIHRNEIIAFKLIDKYTI